MSGGPVDQGPRAGAVAVPVEVAGTRIFAADTFVGEAVAPPAPDGSGAQRWGLTAEVDGAGAATATFASEGEARAAFLAVRLQRDPALRWAVTDLGRPGALALGRRTLTLQGGPRLAQGPCFTLGTTTARAR